MRIHLSRSFYDRVFAPLAAAIMLLIAICPILGWRRSSRHTILRRVSAPALVALATGLSALALGCQHPFVLLAFMLIAFAGSSTARQLVAVVRRSRWGAGNAAQAPGVRAAQRRSLGAQTVHLAILLMAVGILGSSALKAERLVALSPGQRTDIQNYTLQYQGLEVRDEPGRRRHIATLEVYRGDLPVATLRPERNFHWNINDFVTEVSTRSTLMDDLYVALGQPGDDGSMVFRVSIYPLVAWLWIGGTVLLLGTLIAVWPSNNDTRTVL
jgi:cytochrome c-type biogenesis protein CcmF